MKQRKRAKPSKRLDKEREPRSAEDLARAMFLSAERKRKRQPAAG